MPSAGVLDPTFGTGGTVTTDFAGRHDGGSGLAVQADGKILLAGSSAPSSGFSAFALARYNPDGSLDASFGTGGQVLTNFSFPFPNTISAGAADVVLQPDGKVVAVGEARPFGGSPFEFALARYNPDGSLDASFGTGGQVTTDISSFGHTHRAALQADGKIVVAGEGGSILATSLVLARYNPDGSLDATFGQRGVVRLTRPDSFSSAFDVAVQADGKLVAVGVLGPAGPVLVRYNPDGTLDPAFGQGGVASTEVAVDALGRAEGVNGQALALQPDGRIVVAGTLFVGTTAAHFGLARFFPNGNPDPTFGGGGAAGTAFGGLSDAANAVVVQPDGRIVAAGPAKPPGAAAPEFGLARFNPDGSLDTTFGSGGHVVTPIGSAGAVANDAALQADGKIVVGGATVAADNTNVDFALARYLGDDRDADADRRWVAQVFLDLLQRPASPSELLSWEGLLHNTGSRSFVAAGIESSREYRTVVGQGLYGLVLGRAADPGGLNDLVNFLGQGGTAEQAEAILLGSPEYYQRRGGGTDAGFTRALYQDVLGRPPDPTGAQSVGQELAASAPRSLIAAQVLASRESDRDEAEGLYGRLLHWPADPGGLAALTAALQQGLPNEAAIIALVSSDEYYQFRT